MMFSCVTFGINYKNWNHLRILEPPRQHQQPQLVQVHQATPLHLPLQHLFAAVVTYHQPLLLHHLPCHQQPPHLPQPQFVHIMMNLFIQKNFALCGVRFNPMKVLIQTFTAIS